MVAVVVGLAVVGLAVSSRVVLADEAADRCFGFHRFGQGPVDVAKSADGSEVLAQGRWGYHDSIGCYLVLDDGAVGALRAGASAVAPQPTPVSAGGAHSCRLRADQTIGCWGSDEYGQSDAPAGEFLSVSAGSRHSCGLRADQSVECWGYTRHPFTGSFEVHVFYCVSESLGYSDADLEREVEEMSNVAQFFARQSSGLASVRFIPAAVISPDVDWDGVLLDTWHSEVGSYPCQEEIEEWGDARDVLVLTGAEPGGLTSGYAF